MLTASALMFGCGGDDGDEPLTKAEFVKQANELCTEQWKQMQDTAEAVVKKISANTEKSNSANSVTTILTEMVNESVLPGFEAEIEGIEDLGIPPGGEEEVDAILAALQKVVDKAKDDPEAFVRSGVGLYTASQARAAKYGLDACGTPNKPPTS